VPPLRLPPLVAAVAALAVTGFTSTAWAQYYGQTWHGPSTMSVLGDRFLTLLLAAVFGFAIGAFFSPMLKPFRRFVWLIAGIAAVLFALFGPSPGADILSGIVDAVVFVVALALGLRLGFKAIAKRAAPVIPPTSFGSAKWATFDYLDSHGLHGQLGPSRLKGLVTAEVPDLSRFAALTGWALQGAVSATLALDGAPRDGIGDVTVTGHATGLATGVAAVDGVLGADVTASGTARLLPGQGFGFEALEIRGRHVTAVVDGTATAGKAGVTARILVPDLARADRRLSGAGEAVATLSGSLSHPDLGVRIALANGRMLGRPVPRLVLDAEAHDLTGALDAKVALAGESPLLNIFRIRI